VLYLKDNKRVLLKTEIVQIELCYDFRAFQSWWLQLPCFFTGDSFMKKNVLALSIAAMVGGLGFAGAANAALEVNESGAGHILVVPYYTAQNGNMSVFHITNTDMVDGKAVKVRFRGASNSDDVLDFQVFMSPGDVWTAAITKGADGKAQLVTADNSCTLPKITAGVPVPFVTDRLTKSGWTDADKAEQTLEGYVEILTMADIPATANGTNGLFKAIKHVNGVAPCTPAVLNATLAVSPTTVAADAGIAKLTVGGVANTQDDLVAPKAAGSLLGQWYVMNVAQTTTFSGVTPAIVATTAPKNVFSPQKTGTAELLTADPLMVSNLIPAQHYDVPDLSTPYETATTTAQAQATALTTALEKTAVINQYATDAGISAKTDWLFSMPTRRYTIAANYAAPVSDVGAATVAKTDVTATSIAPVALTGTLPTTAYRVINGNMTNIFSTEANTTVNTAGQICVASSGSVFLDREEQKPETAADEPVFSPGTPATVKKFALCGEVNVLAFSADESSLGAKLSRQNVTAPYANGWGTVSFASAVPMLGSAFIKLSNPEAAPGTSGTYGLTWAHAMN
jgi:hypothetical protein